MQILVDEYDSVGFARAVVRDLCENLGVTKTRLAVILLHFAYDGVYATTQQRVDGGGSLNLIHHVASELGLEEGDISGAWDTAHEIQLVWHKTLHQTPDLIKPIKYYFNAMSDFSMGKATTILNNKAREIGALILTSKSYQETRFVRSLLRGLSTGLRNLPTMEAIYQEDLELAIKKCRNADSKELRNKLKQLKSPKHLLLAVGVCYILEIYADTSLEAQHSKHFPSQVWSWIKSAQDKLNKLKDKWVWSGEDVRKAGLEAPRKIVDRLKNEGRFEPKLNVKQVVNRQAEMRKCGLLLESENVTDLFLEEEQVRPLAGEIIMEEETTDEIITEVETKLSTFAGNIHKLWTARQIQTSLEAAACSLLGREILKLKDTDTVTEDVEVADTDVVENVVAADTDVVENVVAAMGTESDTEHDAEGEESDGGDTLTAVSVSVTNSNDTYKKLLNLIQLLPERQGGNFDPSVIFPGLHSWLTFLKDSSQQKQENNVY